MNEDKKKDSEVLEEGSPESRREFLGKAAAAAGVLAATGLVSGLLGKSAEAQEIKLNPALQAQVGGQAALKYSTLQNGHSLSVSGRDLAQTLAREGLLDKNLAGRNAVMSLTLTWS